MTLEPLMSRPDLKRAKRNDLILAKSMSVLRCSRDQVPVKISQMVSELNERRRWIEENA